MQKSVLFISAWLLSCSICPGQVSDTIRIDRLNREAWDLRHTDLEQARKIALLAIREAYQLDYTRGLSFSFNILGHYYKEKGNYDSSYLYYTRSLQIRRQLKDTLNICRSLRNVMGILKQKGKSQPAIDTGLKALPLLNVLQQNDAVVTEMARLQMNLSATFLQTDRYAMAFQHGAAALHLFEQLEDAAGMGEAYQTIGGIFETQGQYAKAKYYYQLALIVGGEDLSESGLADLYNNIGNTCYYLNNTDSALFFYYKSLHLRQKYGLIDDASGSLLNIGTIFEEKKKTDEAEKYYRKSYIQSTTVGNQQLREESALALGRLLFDCHRPKDALPFLQIAYRASLESDLVAEQMTLCKTLGQVFDQLFMKDSSIHYLKLHAALQDTINQRYLSFLSLQDSLREQQHALVMVKANNAMQQLWLVIAIIAIMLLALFTILIYTRGRSKRAMLELQNRINNFELRSADARLEGQEAERQRLAAELHDTLGGILSAAKIAFRSMEQKLEQLLADNKTQFDHIQEMLDEASDKVRQIAHDMASGILQEMGLVEAIGQLCRKLQQSTGVNIRLEQVHGLDERLDYGRELNLYRIVQELLTNALKHAQASEITVQLTRVGETINLLLDDNGKGFHTTSTENYKGMGLKNVDARVKALQGRWRIDSSKGKGTSVLIDIPVKPLPQNE